MLRDEKNTPPLPVRRSSRRKLQPWLASALAVALTATSSVASADQVISSNDVLLGGGVLLLELVTVGASIPNGVALARDERSHTPWVVTGGVGGALTFVVGGVLLVRGIDEARSTEVLFACHPGNTAVIQHGPCTLHPATVPGKCACTEPGDSTTLGISAVFLAIGGVALGLAIAGGRAGSDPSSSAQTSGALTASPAAFQLRTPMLTF